MVELKRWKQLVKPGQCLHLAIILFTPQRTARLHTHDFPEVFWVERGVGRHQINGEEYLVHAGDVVFVRPEDKRVLSVEDAQGFTLVNLAYDPKVWKSLLRRHRAEVAPILDPESKLPYQTRITLPSRGDLTRLAANVESALALEHFLLGLALQAKPSRPGNKLGVPEWLQRACEKMQRPEMMARGVSGFVEVAGRSAEHVARVTRQTLGMTPSDYLNRLRMEHAARELRVTDRPIADIALDCGLNNLSHFYALFRLAHGQTPRDYRRRQVLTSV